MLTAHAHVAYVRVAHSKETVAIKFEDNQAKGAPNQLKTEYDRGLAESRFSELFPRDDVPRVVTSSRGYVADNQRRERECPGLLQAILAACLRAFVVRCGWA